MDLKRYRTLKIRRCPCGWRENQHHNWQSRRIGISSSLPPSWITAAVIYLSLTSTAPHVIIKVIYAVFFTIFPPARRWIFLSLISSRSLKSKPVSCFWLYTVIISRFWYFYNFNFVLRRLYIKNIYFIYSCVFGGCICKDIPSRILKHCCRFLVVLSEISPFLSTMNCWSNSRSLSTISYEFQVLKAVQLLFRFQEALVNSCLSCPTVAYCPLVAAATENGGSSPRRIVSVQCTSWTVPRYSPRFSAVL